MRRVGIALLAAGVLGGTVGCSYTYTRTMSGTDDSVLMVFVKKKYFGSETGIVECDRSDDGSLSGCKQLNVEYEKKAAKK